MFAVYVLSGGPPPKLTKVANEAKAADSSYSTSESIEWFIEGQAFSLPPHSPTSNLALFSQSSCVSLVELSDSRERWEGGGPWKSLALYKSFSTLLYATSKESISNILIWIKAELNAHNHTVISFYCKDLGDTESWCE